jgi:hypothetical protein
VELDGKQSLMGEKDGTRDKRGERVGRRAGLMVVGVSSVYSHWAQDTDSQE